MSEEKPVRIPENLEDCFSVLSEVMTGKTLEDFKMADEEDLIRYHFSLGMWIRNNFGLWTGSHLAQFFIDLGIFDADEMSGVIILSFHRMINDKEIRLKEQLKEHHDYL